MCNSDTAKSDLVCIIHAETVKHGMQQAEAPAFFSCLMSMSCRSIGALGWLIPTEIQVRPCWGRFSHHINVMAKHITDGHASCMGHVDCDCCEPGPLACASGTLLD